jgi:hypothetical protein
VDFPKDLLVFTVSPFKRRQQPILLLPTLLVAQYGIIWILNYLFPDTDSLYSRPVASQSTLMTTLLYFVFGPIKEEVKYRLLLGNFNYRNFITSTVVFFSDTLFVLIFSVTSPLQAVVYFLAVAILAMFSYFVLPKSLAGSEEYFRRIYSRYYLLIFHVSAIAFSLSHALDPWRDEGFVLLLVVYFFNAVIFSYVRVNFGIVAAIVYHFIFNLPTFVSIAMLVEW